MSYLLQYPFNLSVIVLCFIAENWGSQGGYRTVLESYSTGRSALFILAHCPTCLTFFYRNFQLNMLQKLISRRKKKSNPLLDSLTSLTTFSPLMCPFVGQPRDRRVCLDSPFLPLAIPSALSLPPPCFLFSTRVQWPSGQLRMTTLSLPNSWLFVCVPLGSFQPLTLAPCFWKFCPPWVSGPLISTNLIFSCPSDYTFSLQVLFFSS